MLKTMQRLGIEQGEKTLGGRPSTTRDAAVAAHGALVPAAMREEASLTAMRRLRARLRYGSGCV